jgi:8-oxo-dGTP diphosphatase
VTSVRTIWPTGPVLLSWVPGDTCDLPITGSHAFCFTGDSVLVCEIRGRGLSIPGGHLDNGETPRDCLIRELREEACAEIERAVLIGFLVVDHSVNATYTGHYPEKSALAVFAVLLGELEPYVPSGEAQSRVLIEADALPGVHHQWDIVLDEAYRDARRAIVA